MMSQHLSQQRGKKVRCDQQDRLPGRDVDNTEKWYLEGYETKS
jgi:hypothetical protein